MKTVGLLYSETTDNSQRICSGSGLVLNRLSEELCERRELGLGGLVLLLSAVFACPKSVILAWLPPNKMFSKRCLDEQSAGDWNADD
jgi:hypothetical protein